MARIGPYEIVEEVGRGAMGVVFRGLDPVIGRAVAIKVIQLREYSDERERAYLRERLYAEARAAGVLSHPGIVTIYQVGEEADQAYVAMEFVDGSTLERVLEQGAVRRDRILDILDQVAAALDYAHGQGVAHRDIKPANIMLRTDGRVKITDFGIAKFFAARRTTGVIVGTPHYMSPEQIEGRPMDGRADQFSLGVIAYEMLTGARPFAAQTLTTLFYQILHQEPAPVAAHNPSLGDKVAGAVNRALAKEPAARYGGCQEFAAALRSACEALPDWAPTPAAPPERKRLHTVVWEEPEVVSQVAPIELVQSREPLPSRDRKGAGRTPLWLWGGGAVVLGCVAGLLVYHTVLSREGAPREKVSYQPPVVTTPAPAPARVTAPEPKGTPPPPAAAPPPNSVVKTPVKAVEQPAAPPQAAPELTAPVDPRPVPIAPTPVPMPIAPSTGPVREATPKKVEPIAPSVGPVREASPKVVASAPPPAPKPPSKPAAPASGRVTWRGELARGKTLTIETGRPSLSLTGRFPRAPMRLTAHAAEQAGGAIRTLPEGSINILQIPDSGNDWKLVVQAGDRKITAIVFDWELIP